VIDVFDKPATKDVVAPNCEKVVIGFGAFEEFVVSIPQRFFEGLPPPFNQW
jgi:hypothetical protein